MALAIAECARAPLRVFYLCLLPEYALARSLTFSYPANTCGARPSSESTAPCVTDDSTMDSARAFASGEIMGPMSVSGRWPGPTCEGGVMLI